ncbi:MAG: DUF934 domain-containing protein [Acetobacteraceae bacterium]
MKRFDLKSCASTPTPPESSAVALPEATRATTSIRLNVDDDITTLTPFLPHLQSVILVFPNFQDGRAFTQARALREKLKFAGEILAEGHPLPDQIDFMRRCGFNTVLLEDDAACAAWAAHKTHFPQNYQNRLFPLESPRAEMRLHYAARRWQMSACAPHEQSVNQTSAICFSDRTTT